MIGRTVSAVLVAAIAARSFARGQTSGLHCQTAMKGLHRSPRRVERAVVGVDDYGEAA